MRLQSVDVGGAHAPSRVVFGAIAENTEKVRTGGAPVPAREARALPRVCISGGRGTGMDLCVPAKACFGGTPKPTSGTGVLPEFGF